MKNKIFMYLFIFSVLLIIFQYANSKNILDQYEEDISYYKDKIEEQEATISQLENETLELNSFCINNNEQALTYFEDQGFDTEDLLPKIEDALYETNNYEGDDHSIVPYVSMTENKILINQVRILNHKWIVANFTDGAYWGEVFLTYDVSPEGDISFERINYFMYPRERY